MARRVRRVRVVRGPRGPRVVYRQPTIVTGESVFYDHEPDEYVEERRELDEAGDLLPTIVTPDDARRQIDETDTAYDRVNAAILASSTAPPEFKTSWALQYGGWKTFATGARVSVGFLNTKAVMDQTDRYVEQLGNWHKAFQQVGGSSAGPAPMPAGQGVPSTSKPLGELTGLIVAAGVVAAIVVFGPRLAKE